MSSCPPSMLVLVWSLVIIFYRSITHPFLGATPDGLVSCSFCSEKGLLEIKCPYKYMNADLHQANDCNFYLKRINTELRLNKSHLYYFQIQGQLAICKDCLLDTHKHSCGTN